MNVAFIPVRGGSKSIPLKNIKEICGKPLVYWTVLAASQCTYIDKVYVATDSEKIRATLEKYNLSKVEVIGRSAESATDTASTEMAMLEFAEQYEFLNIALVQATSPLLKADDLNRGFQKFLEKDSDSVLSVVRQKRFQWSVNEQGYARPTNYDVFHRPRRQEFEGYLVENGAFYITSKKDLLESKNRVSGNIKIVEMCEESFCEIDEPSDFIIVEELMKNRLKNGKDSRKVKMFLTDCDGCLTDGGMYYLSNGIEAKKFHTADGMGIGLLRDRDIVVGIITGENTMIVEERASKLKIAEVYQGVKDKEKVVKILSEKYNIPFDSIAYVGDDVNDLGVMSLVGYPCSVANAQECVKSKAIYVSQHQGGDGAVREIIDWLLSSL